MLIERGGATAALRAEGGNLVFPPATAASYSVDNWLLADGDERDAAAASDQGAFRCDPLGCIGVVKGKTHCGNHEAERAGSRLPEAEP